MARKNPDNTRSYLRNYYLENRDKILLRSKEYREKNALRIAEWKILYRKNNAGKIAKQLAEYRDKNKEAIDILSKKQRSTAEFKERRNTYLKEKYHSDIQHRLRVTLRNRLNDAIGNGYKSGSAVNDLGCTIPEVKFYLEGMFKAGMSWDNFGEWHIDHIFPLSLFDLSERDELKRACHYSNLQPLWAVENLKKNNKIILRVSN